MKRKDKSARFLIAKLSSKMREMSLLASTRSHICKSHYRSIAALSPSANLQHHKHTYTVTRFLIVTDYIGSVRLITAHYTTPSLILDLPLSLGLISALELLRRRAL